MTNLPQAIVPDDMAGAPLELQTEDGIVAVGWMTRRFMHGAPTFWTWDRAPDAMHPRCVAPLAWRAAEGAR